MRFHNRWIKAGFQLSVCVCFFLVMLQMPTFAAEASGTSPEATPVGQGTNLASGESTPLMATSSESRLDEDLVIIASDCLNYQRYVLKALEKVPTTHLGPTELPSTDDRWPDAPGKLSLDPDSLFAKTWLPGVLLKQGTGNGIATRSDACAEWRFELATEGWMISCPNHGGTPESEGRFARYDAAVTESERLFCEAFMKSVREALSSGPATATPNMHLALNEGEPIADSHLKNFPWKEKHPDYPCVHYGYLTSSGWDIKCDKHGFLLPMKDASVASFTPPSGYNDSRITENQWIALGVIGYIFMVIIEYWPIILGIIIGFILLFIGGMVFFSWYWKNDGNKTPPEK